MQMNNQRMKEFSVKASEDESFSFEGYLSTFGNEDRVGDVIERGAFDDSLKKKTVVPMLLNHERDAIIGKMELSVDAIGLFVKGYLLESVQKAKEVYDLLKFGALDSMSIGMLVKDYEPIDKQNPYGSWIIKSAEVLEGSVVTVPANEQAIVTSVKTMDEMEKLKSENLALKKEVFKLKIELEDM